MAKLLLIGAERESHTDNLQRLQNSFSSCGWSVATALHDDLSLDHGKLRFKLNYDQDMEVDEFDWIWVIGFGSRATFLDRMQLLRSVEQSKFVNSVDAFLLYQNKATLAMTTLSKYSPHTMVSANAEDLTEKVHNGGHWIAKPTAGSFGRDVFELHANDPNLTQILENLTRNGYAILQDRVETAREQRWFVAMGSDLGAYQKVKPGLRGNMRAASSATICEPNSLEIEMVRSVAADLIELGIGACAIDIAYPYLLDVNFVNPGWFQTMESLTGEDFSSKIPPLFSKSKR